MLILDGSLGLVANPLTLRLCKTHRSGQVTARSRNTARERAFPCTKSLRAYSTAERTNVRAALTLECTRPLQRLKRHSNFVQATRWDLGRCNLPAVQS